MRNIQRPASTRNSEVASGFEAYRPGDEYDEYRPEDEHRDTSVALRDATGRFFTMRVPTSWECCEECRRRIISRSLTKARYALEIAHEGRAVFVYRAAATTSAERRALSDRIRGRAEPRDVDRLVAWSQEGVHLVIASGELEEGRRGPHGGDPADGNLMECREALALLESMLERRLVHRQTLSNGWQRPKQFDQLGLGGTRRLEARVEAIVDSFNGWLRERGFKGRIERGRYGYTPPPDLPDRARRELDRRLRALS